jgi:hypothetical protein
MVKTVFSSIQQASNWGAIASLNAAGWFVDAIGQRRLTIIDMARSLTSL